MTITSNELAQLKAAAQCNTVSVLIEKWESQIYANELQKKDSVEFSLTNQQDGVTIKVVGKRVASDFAFHKDAWGGSFWRLTHLETTVSIFAGKKNNIVNVVKKLTTWQHLPVFQEALKVHGVRVLVNLPQEIRDEYRQMYDEAAGN